MKDKLFIIILNYNCKADIIDCLKSLKYIDKKSYLLKLLVVDNASADGSVQLIKQKFPQVKIIQNKKNLGFAAGVNVGIKYALKQGADFVFLLNPDTIVEKDFLQPLVQLIKSDTEIGIVSPVLKGMFKGKLVYDLGAKFNPFLGRTKHIHVKFRPLHPMEAEMVSGCAMLVKKEVFEKIGFFNKHYFLYFEDSDFCLRAKKAGFKIYVQSKSIVFHRTSQSLGEFSLKKIYHILISNFLFINKHVKFYLRPLAYIYLSALTFKIVFNKISKIL